jgi:hypothetical protein
MKATLPKHVDITSATYLSGYQLRLAFSDGTAQVVDFEQFLRHAKHPDLLQYRALKRFRTFRVYHGNVMWGDYEMLFPIADLYRGEI